MNPLLTKELCSRMRSGRTYIVQVIYIIALAFVVFVVYADAVTGRSWGVQRFSRLGKNLFTWVSMIQLALVSLISPGLTCGSISLEKEKQTFDMLLVTPLTRGDIIWGKILSSISYVILLVLVSLPLISISFIFGGIAPTEVLMTYSLLMLYAFSFGVIGFCCSNILRKTSISTIITFSIVLFLMLGVLLVALLLDELTHIDNDLIELFLFPFSPFVALLAIIEDRRTITILNNMPIWLASIIFYIIMDFIILLFVWLRFYSLHNIPSKKLFRKRGNR